MQSPDLSSETLFIQRQLNALKDAFDLALKKDLTLGEVKKIFHEMKLMQDKLDNLEQPSLTNTKIKGESHRAK